MHSAYFIMMAWILVGFSKNIYFFVLVLLGLGSN